MNKTSNLSIFTLLYMVILIFNVYADGPWNFKLQFGDLQSHIDITINDAYYQLECSKNEAGTAKTIWKSTEDGFDFVDGSATLPAFDIPSQDSISTPWYIVDTDHYYYSCELYVYQSQTTGDDTMWAKAPLKLNVLENSKVDQKQIVYILNPDDESEFYFHVDLWAEVKSYPGPWKITLSTGMLSNLMDRDFTGLYFKLSCTTAVDSLAGDATIYISYQDGYCWIEEPFSPPKKVTCEKFNVKADGPSGMFTVFTGWNISPDLYFYGCDLYLASTNSVGYETKWAVNLYPLPLRIANDFSTMRYVGLYKVDDASDKRFGLEYQLLAEIPQ